MNISRRSFLQLMGLSTGAVLAPRVLLAEGQASDDDILVILFQRGAADSLSLIPPYADADYARHRPTLAIPSPGAGEGAALDLDGFFGMHPSLSPLHSIYQAGQLAVIVAAGSPNDSHSHFLTQSLMERGLGENMDATTGWLGRYLDYSSMGDGSMFRSIGMGISAQASLEQALASPIAMTEIADFALVDPQSQEEQIKAMLSSLYAGGNPLDVQSGNALSAIDLLAEANPAQYQVQNGAEYPAGTFGQQLMETAQLIRSGLGIQAVAIDIGGWDTHEGQAATLDVVGAEFAQGIAAFNQDMGEEMGHITLVTMTEFGRRVYENGSGGTDHGHASFMLALGGNVNGGMVYQNWPGLADGNLYGAGDLQVTIDYRTVLAELISKRTSGMSIEELFPGGGFSTDELGIFKA